MSQATIETPVRKDQEIKVAKSDLVEAWSLLENLAVSLNQIGSSFGQPVEGPRDEELHRQMLHALDAYLTPDLLEALNTARMRLADYLPREEVEDLAGNVVPYWNYKGFKNGKYQP